MSQAHVSEFWKQHQGGIIIGLAVAVLTIVLVIGWFS